MDLIIDTGNMRIREIVRTHDSGFGLEISTIYVYNFYFLYGGWPLIIAIGTKLATPVERQGRKAPDLIELKVAGLQIYKNLQQNLT